MYEISIKCPLSIVDDNIEKLQINEIYNVYYNSPIVIVTDEYGYDYKEKSGELVDLVIVVDSDDKDLVDSQVILIKDILDLNIDELKVKKSDPIDFEPKIEAIDLNNGWIIGHPNDCKNEDNNNKINFVHKGAFGSGLHETTQDCLRYILKEDFSNKTVLDIGTGSGILSIAASIKGASKVTSIDIRDVRDEIEFNASLNDLNNIEIIVGDVIEEDIKIDNIYDYVFINIGGQETQSMMEFIDSKLSKNGKLLVSGLVSWSFDKVISFIESHGYKLNDHCTSNEWCTAWVIKNS
ncbi:ribosomal protein L11 methyltransferase PrmA [Gottschalkia acidurici 9a]|uniref:Ribosomal protein L11 methyltransferase PrmA n=1 Tax=Gottschalkia acidurici (strain ATCC 7906 / DSM 604 / BCRC 14475 / CIP 104303 / KCTC 5404 / NCIMB 10678 / 9a) TaxID=1128398 RepID=K0B0U5_GOTA9|nr:50S ribosomal protein L11 methyltransferase [Gottschalkia acidurici]AFS78540.1 ribosomal protein L11 methyltransferase PrmA [Gottschalkia acidurici 9a]